MECPGCFDNSTSFPQHHFKTIFVNYANRRRFERSVGYIVGPAFVSLNSVSLIANVAILAILFHRGVRNRTAGIIINLAINDILILCIGTPWRTVTYVSDSWPFGSGLCKLSVYGLMLTLHVEMYTILLLACLRYFAITKPLTSAVVLTKKKIYLLVSVLWITAILLNIPAAKFATLVPFSYDNKTETVCIRMSMKSSTPAERTYVKCHFVMTYTVPLLITFALLGMSIHKLNKSNMFIVGQAQYTRKRKQAVHRLIVLTLIYAICVLPVSVLSFVRFMVSSATRHSKEFIIAEICALFCAFMRCAVHPFLYNCMAKDFRKDAVKMITRQNSFSSDFTRRCNSDIHDGCRVMLYISTKIDDK